ncbi:hypothetical protein J3R03_001279 [Actinoplanes couchii]|nr:hypothetical protein [Actinoplanes couchii]
MKRKPTAFAELRIALTSYQPGCHRDALIPPSEEPLCPIGSSPQNASRDSAKR